MAFFSLLIRTQHVLIRNYSISIKSSLLGGFKPRIRCNKASLLILEYHASNILYKRRKTNEEKKSTRIIEYPPKKKLDVVEVWRDITVGELANLLENDIKYVSDLFLNEIKGSKTVIKDLDKLYEAIRRSGKRMQIIKKPISEAEVEDKDVYPRPPPDKSQLRPRPPVVTVMGHVDHGKTTLLDALRSTRVVDQEFGGITQHIGAFSVTLRDDAKITFLDTPGHAAFTAMRERGANVTDIVVLVVAADDGVMEQTIESVRMAKQAGVPILIAINKIDAPKADVEQTEKNLMEIGILVEKYGGDVQAIPISALKKQNLDQLTEALILQADLLDIKADPSGFVEAVVIESKVHPHRGRLGTIIIQRGTLKKGDVLLSSTKLCKVRALKDADGKMLEEAPPGFAVEVEGWDDLPSPGDLVLQVDSEKRARNVIKVRERKLEEEKAEEILPMIQQKQDQHNREYREKLDMKRKLGRFRLKSLTPRQKETQDSDSTTPTLNVIVKTDVDGTLEAILNTLDSYDLPDCKMELVNYGVGTINESDVELAKLFNAVIYAFNVKVQQRVTELAEASDINIKHYNVIYKLIDDVKMEINKLLPEREVEEVIGEATVLQQFDINEGKRKVSVAGSRCTKGMLKRAAKYRLVRNEAVLFDGTLSSMRHLKSEVDTIKKDLDCGLQLNDKEITFQPGDTIICYEIKKIPQTTEWDPGF